MVDGEYRHNLSVIAGDELTGMQAVFAGEAVAVSEPLSRRCRLSPGDTLQLEGPRGLVTARVAAVYADYSRDQGFVMMNLKLFSRLRDDNRAMSAAVE